MGAIVFGLGVTLGIILAIILVVGIGLAIVRTSGQERTGLFETAQ